MPLSCLAQVTAAGSSSPVPYSYDAPTLSFIKPTSASTQGGIRLTLVVRDGAATVCVSGSST